MIDVMLSVLTDYFIFNCTITFVLGWMVYHWITQKWLNLPPGPVGLPIFGNILSLGRRAEISFSNMARKYGPIFTVYMGPNRTVVLNTAEAIEEAYIKNGSVLCGRPHNFFSKLMTDDKGMIFLKGVSTWKTQRSFSSRALSGAGLQGKSIEERILDEAQSLCEVIQKKNGQPFILEDELLLSIANVINGITMRERWSSSEQNFGKEAVDSFRKFGWLHGLLMILPWTRFIPFVKRKVNILTKIRDAGREFYDQSIKEHMKRFDSNDLQDLVDLFLLQHYQKAYTFENLKQLTVLVGDLFIAGTETTTSTIRWVLFEIMRYPEIQQKIHNELEEVLGSGGKVNLRLDLPYTRAVIQEAFRVQTLTPLSVPRRTLQDINLMGYHVPKNTQVIPNLWAVHNNPDYWPEPDKFIPERHLDENGKFVKSNKVIPFSIGSRNCLGENLARSEVFLFVVSILQKFELLPNPDDPTPPDEGEMGFVYSAPHYPLIMREK